MKNTLDVTFRDISFSSPSASCITLLISTSKLNLKTWLLKTDAMASESQDSLAEQYTVPSQQHLPRNALEKGRKSLRTAVHASAMAVVSTAEAISCLIHNAEQDEG